MNTKFLGKKGESFAEKLLIKNGYKILFRNYTCHVGEIDIIANEKDTLVLVEVKTRKSVKYGLPEEAVTRRKLNKISMVGQYYLKEFPNSPKKQRIDVISINLNKNGYLEGKIIKYLG